MKVQTQTKMVPRAVLPRREDHRIVPGLARPRRNFRITAGLREGWGPAGRVSDVSVAVVDAARA
jgi:hypothetical protein